MNQSPYKPRGGRRAPVLFLSLLLLTGMVAAGFSAWWLLLRDAGQIDDARQQYTETLQLRAAQIDTLVDALVLASAQFLQSTNVSSADRLLRVAAELPSSFTQNTGLTAIAIWPESARTAPTYLRRQGEQWAIADLNLSDPREALQRQPWFHLVADLGRERCLWSRIEREATSGTLVLTCSRALRDARGRNEGILRLSFAVETLFTAVTRADPAQILLLVDGAGSLLASNASSLQEVRSIPEIGQRLPAVAPLLTQLYLEQENRLDNLGTDGRVAEEVLTNAVAAGAFSDLDAARRVVAAATAPAGLFASEPLCQSGWCRTLQTTQNAPWRLISVRPQPPAVFSALDAHQPLIAGLAALMALLILAFWIVRGIVLAPLSRLISPLLRQDAGPVYDESLRGEFGILAHALNELAENNRNLRQQLLDPRRASARAGSDAGGSLALANLPLPALILGRNGKVLESNDGAVHLLGLRAGDGTDNHHLKLQSNSQQIALSAIPVGWHATECELVELGSSTAVAISSAATADGKARLILIHPIQHGAGAVAPAASQGEVVDAVAQRQALLRRALQGITAVVDWALIEAEPELALPGTADGQAVAAFSEQLRARVEDRLEDGESVLRWGPGQFILHAPRGISRQRTTALCQGLQSALIFADGQRVRLRCAAHTLSVQPGMRIEDVDAAVVSAKLAKPAEPGTTESRRSYAPAEWTALVTRGFAAKRFHLITQFGLPPAGTSQSSTFRVLPHLEDDEGFWISQTDFLPAVERVGRRSELDNWLVEKVHQALTQLRGAPPNQVLLPVGPQSLTATGNTIAENLANLVRSPALKDCRIVVCMTADEIRRAAMDPARVRSLIHSLGCGFALDRLNLDTASMALLDQAQPDLAIMHPQLTTAALRSSSFAIGLESLVRAAEKLKAETILTAVNDQAAKQLAERVGVSLAFGTAISKPSPMLFQAVA